MSLLKWLSDILKNGTGDILYMHENWYTIFHESMLVTNLQK